MSYVTVSAKIPRRIKELMEKYNIKPGEVIRAALEEEVKKRALAELAERARVLSKRLTEIEDEEVARIIREDRERR